ncbi:hypothetical protein M406DRAFT_249597 [Cryphonectria parasitica EP155]|uniref:Uncharacterized protein n=1 Tax=Cryphonectria parasitica (strain ATCC 38755 / EP155) TaxID=660469 RepID=A0A9P4YAK9_CRYP1|nr:uncharacterized protein M406DRAFT_249597 [Cryphonectria parasitica EP155]KAF3769125.1 hypothetical protein M406DRAFT_249597 [Cryphonectria parasitica EP155]
MGEKERQCEYYGSFMHHLSRPEAEAMYWCLFFLVLCLLFSASWYYGRVMERIEHMRVSDTRRKQLIHWCFYKTLACSFVSLVAAILEVFVLLTLQFCDHEPLASLYWSNWTVLQVGAVVAMFGICLHVRHMIKGRRHPPWALALGTPVLVVAGLGHYFQGKVKSKAKSVGRNLRSRSHSRRPRGRSRDEPLSKM